MFDIDKTLLGVDYKPNSEHFRDVVLALRAAGWDVGLNSDTGPARIAKLALFWDCNAPIVAEFGNAIYSVENALQGLEPDWIRRPDSEPFFDSVLGRFLCQVRKLFPDLYILTCEPYAGLDLLRHMELDKALLLVNGSRRHSLSFFVRMPKAEQDKGKALLQSLGDLAVDCFRRQADLDIKIPLVDLNPEYMVFIMHFADSAKCQAQPFLQERYDVIAMVGDSMNDFLARPGEVSPCYQMAVGNANPAYKALCQYVASDPLTCGAIQCAEHLLALPESLA